MPSRKITSPSWYWFIVALVPAICFVFIQEANAENWTNLRGTHSIEAELLGIWQDSAVFEMPDGRRVTVRLSDLRSESRIQAHELAKELAQGRSERVKELQELASALAASAPDPLPKPPAARPYQPPKKDAKAEDFLSQIDRAVLDGHLLAVYEAFPPSYRKDIDTIVQAGAKKISSHTWQSIFGTLHQLGDLVVTRQQWLLSSPRTKNLPPSQLDQVETNLMTLAGLLRDTLNPDAVTLEKIQTMGFGQFLAERDEVLAPHLAQLLDQVGAVERRIRVESEEGGKAMVHISSGTASTIEFTLVEGYWVPSILAQSWTNKITELKNSINEIPEDSLWQSYGLTLAPILDVIDPLKQATDATKFHLAMEEIIDPLQSVVTNNAALIGLSIDLDSENKEEMEDQ